MSLPELSFQRCRRALAAFPVAELLVGLALCVSASLSIGFTRLPGGIALFWPGSAIAAALLIRMPQVRWLSTFVIVPAALYLSNAVAAHNAWHIASGFVWINSAEIALMVVAFRFVWRLPYPAIDIDGATLMAAVFGVVIPGVMAGVGGLFLHLNNDASWAAATLQWWSSHTIGACFFGPPMILWSSRGMKRLLRPGYAAKNALTLLICLIGCYLTVRYVRFPFVSMGLMLLIAAFSMGGFGASLMSLSFGLMIAGLWMAGVRPGGLDPASAAGASLMGLPVIAVLATVLPPIAVGLGSDARRSAARALRVSERRFRESMAHSPIGMLIAELDGTWTYTNIALQKMLGYTAEEFRAMPPGGPCKGEDTKDAELRLRRLLTGHVDFYDVTRCFRHNDGHWVWTHVSVSLSRDEDGMPLHMIVQVESLESRQQAEQNLAMERERLKITLGSISDAVITTDSGTRITYVNAAAVSLLGQDAPTVENRRVNEVVQLMDLQTGKAAANLLGQSACHGKVFRREGACVLHRPDGSVSFVTDVVSPVIDTTGVLTGLVIVLRDAASDIDRGRDLQYRASHDALTGLSNRADFNQRAQDAFARTRLLDQSSAVIAIDLDRFKAVNDSAGHAAGDAVLCKVAEACRGAVRSSDTVARLGGDEFAILIENCAEERAHRIGKQILAALNPLSIEWQGTHHSVNASLGLAMSSAAMPDARAWCEAADKACYVAKHDGRGRLELASHPLDAGKVARRA